MRTRPVCKTAKTPTAASGTITVSGAFSSATPGQQVAQGLQV
jgi:hypothetical protein